jgi:hypothetical protein
MRNLTPAAVRKALAAIYGKGQIEIYRHQSGYYYFTGERVPMKIESIVAWDLSAWSLEEILQHVAGAIRDEASR